MQPSIGDANHAVAAGGIRKKIRKGTRSCFECRRRKVRCIYSSNSSTICVPCLERNIKCTDQQSGNPDIVLDKRKPLRDRVAHLESLMQKLSKVNSGFDGVKVTNPAPGETTSANGSFTHSDSDELLTSPSADGDPSYVGDNGSAPLLFLFDNDVWSRDGLEQQQYHLSGKSLSPEIMTPKQSTAKSTDEINLNIEGSAPKPMKKQKDEVVCQALKRAIQSQEKLQEAQNKNAIWWAARQMRIFGSSSKTEQPSLITFMSHAIAHGSPLEMATVVQLVATVSDEPTFERLVLLIERLVLNDDQYIGTIEGLECALFQYKLYSDSGQARRSLLVYRRAMVFAQLLGLHRTRTSVRQDIVWWGLYSADRMTSLMLGVPYMVPDSHCNMNYRGQDLSLDMTALGFMVKVAVVNGEVADLTYAGPNAPYSSVLELDRKLNHLQSQMVPKSRRLISQRAPNDVGRVNMWQETAFMQLVYHQTKVLLHLPYMFKGITTSEFEHSRLSCFQDSRAMLQIFHKLRAVENDFAFKCKAIDFIGFLAGTVLTIGLLGYGNGSTVNDQRRNKEDWQLVETTLSVFDRVSSDTFGKIVSQCHHTLSRLVQLRDILLTGQNENSTTQIVVPFFGLVNFQLRKSCHCSPNHLLALSTSTVGSQPRRSSEAQDQGPGTKIPAASMPNSSFELHINPTTEVEFPTVENWTMADPQFPSWWQDLGGFEVDQNWDWMAEYMPQP